MACLSLVNRYYGFCLISLAIRCNDNKAVLVSLYFVSYKNRLNANLLLVSFLNFLFQDQYFDSFQLVRSFHFQHHRSVACLSFCRFFRLLIFLFFVCLFRTHFIYCGSYNFDFKRFSLPHFSLVLHVISF